VNEWCGARFDRLFADGDAIGEFRYFDRDGDADAYVHSHTGLIIDHDVSPYCDIPNVDMVKAFGDARRLQEHPVIIIRSWARFYPTPIPFAKFTPITSLRNRISDVTSAFRRTAGVHVRRTDHSDAIAESPTTAFVRAMADDVVTGAATEFFLATDDPQEERLLRRDFRIVTYRKRTLNRATPEGIEDALVDLFCLGATRHIIGSAGSTFSFVASQLAGIPLRIATP
jgi:hypothetical protein